MIPWEEQEQGYAKSIELNDYHYWRTKFILRLFPGPQNLVLDFGCGEGFFSQLLLEQNLAKSIIALDPSESLVNVAKNRSLLDSQSVILGGVEALSQIRDLSVDTVVALNVLAYMTKSEELAFYKNIYRVLKPDGSLVVTHSNELFDAITFNNLTVDFYKTNFNFDVSNFLNLDNQSDQIMTYNIRENPLAYKDKLQNLGFQQVKIDFFHRHRYVPRSNAGHLRSTIDSEFESEMQKIEPSWKDNFISSTFGVLAKKI